MRFMSPRDKLPATGLEINSLFLSGMKRGCRNEGNLETGTETMSGDPRNQAPLYLKAPSIGCSSVVAAYFMKK
jgi:hypothetical protein